MNIHEKQEKRMAGETRNNVKTAAIETIKSLPEEADWNDVMHRIYVRQKIESGLKDVENGDTISHSDVEKRFGIKE